MITFLAILFAANIPSFQVTIDTCGIHNQYPINQFRSQKQVSNLFRKLKSDIYKDCNTNTNNDLYIYINFGNCWKRRKIILNSGGKWKQAPGLVINWWILGYKYIKDNNKCPPEKHIRIS
eukprot:NODE_344_length_9080_cov_0.340051.p5 type:complete len:120 gc:universal NODE_344_length_9080_cov_0.340051:8681-8322(-)